MTTILFYLAIALFVTRLSRQLTSTSKPCNHGNRSAVKNVFLVIHAWDLHLKNPLTPEWLPWLQTNLIYGYSITIVFIDVRGILQLTEWRIMHGVQTPHVCMITLDSVACPQPLESLRRYNRVQRFSSHCNSTLQFTEAQQAALMA